MRKVILFNMVTLDGFFAGPGGEIDWHHTDGEFNEFAIHQLDTSGGLIFGRETYQLMASYWPTPSAIQDDPIVADRMNSLPKLVFSRTLEKADWKNTKIIKEFVAGEISKLKQQPGKDLYLFGSADLAATFIKEDLIDEFRLIINPVIIGRGRPMFQEVKEKLSLKLIRTKQFRNGNVLLIYQMAQPKTS